MNKVMRGHYEWCLQQMFVSDEVFMEDMFKSDVHLYCDSDTGKLRFGTPDGPLDEIMSPEEFELFEELTLQNLLTEKRS